MPLDFGKYLATCYAITILYGLFYIVILAKGEDYFTLPSCHGADFIFRMTFSFNFSTTPPRTVITFIAEFKKSSPQIDHGTAATVGTVWTSSTSRAATAENDIDIERRIGDAEREPDDPLQSLRLALQQKLRIPETVREPMMMGPITKSAGHGKTNFMGAKSRKQSATPLQDVEDECEAEERLSEDPAILNDPDDPTKALRMALKQKMKGAEPARKMPVTQPPKVARK
ncbi:hypothetical protein BC936DRAFT_137927 [Jimgerdemannia flammicorona]|uniref:Uncharacterized protein n=1 Tax=Jimgerdemannia flammicorona TaxID=994334 RepID=A0A433CWE2_9FUNG|nr:hypothetical protein BC936DRAFT_137927 [Jimgerdemannia flammicorona]